MISTEISVIDWATTETNPVWRVFNSIKCFSQEPNPIDAYNRLKEEINEIHRIDEDEINDREDLTRREKNRLIREYRRHPAIDYKNNLITIRQNNEMTEERFVTMVQDILNEKYEVDNLAQE